MQAVGLDPITFEVVKHRLWQINDEQGFTIRSISTSPIVVEGNDMNAGLFTKEGNLVMAGPYVLVHVTTMDTVIKNILWVGNVLHHADLAGIDEAASASTPPTSFRRRRATS